VLSAMALSVLLCGCEPPVYRDGTYSARSSPDDDGQYGEVTLTIVRQKITSCQYRSYNRDGTIKDAEYGLKGQGGRENRGYYEKAQFALTQVPRYAQQLMDRQSIGKVDRISGATIAYDQFVECVERILDEAEDRSDRSN
ncbi:MAG: FMN-binding protein, partial [Succinivibrio sp.]